MPVHDPNERKATLVVPEPDFGNYSGASSESLCSSGKSNHSTAVSPRASPTVRTLRRKLVMIGDGAAGKTSLLVAYKEGTFSVDYTPTVFENSITSVPVEDRVVELSLWDTAGQEDYDRLRPLSYPDTHVILLCYAVDKPESLRNVQRKWVHELNQYCPEVPRILVACKIDLRPESLLLHQCFDAFTSTEAGRSVANAIGASSFIETSSLTMYNVGEVFAQAARVSLTYQDPKSRRKARKNSKNTPITPTATPSKSLSRRCFIQ